MKHTFSSALLLTVTSIFLIFSLASNAQDLTLKQVADVAERSDALSENFIPPNSKESPLSAMLALRKANNDGNIELASTYLDLRYPSKAISNIAPEDLLRKLVIIWSQNHILDLSTLSDKPEGHLNDGLPDYRDLIGKFELDSGSIPIYLQRIPDSKGNKVWKISNTSVAKIPMLWEEFGYHPIAESLSSYLPSFKVFNMENWQFASLLIILIATWYATALIRLIMLKITNHLNTYKEAIQQFIRTPLRMFLYFTLLQWGISFLGLSLSARVWLESGTLGYLAAIFLLPGLIEFGFFIYSNKRHKDAVTIFKPLVFTLKIVMIIVIALNWLQDAGFNITTVLTGLGIGSLAIALAAQKTLENVFGAFTLFIARPIQLGDFCEFGDISGTVEEIGLRSTRIRKLNRSVVHIPNSVFASNNLINYAEIDRRHYRRELRLRLDSSPDQIRVLLIALRKLILSHPKTLDVESRVRFEKIERDAFLIVMNAYVSTQSIVEFKAVEEDLNLRALEIVIENNIELAIPEQHLFISRHKPKDSEVAATAKASIDELSKNNQLPFPNFQESEIAEFINTLPYPPEGAPKTK